MINVQCQFPPPELLKGSYPQGLSCMHVKTCSKLAYLYVYASPDQLWSDVKWRCCTPHATPRHIRTPSRCAHACPLGVRRMRRPNYAEHAQAPQGVERAGADCVAAKCWRSYAF
eukprot:4050937-Pleurochrysis_carterae.AAC.1